MQMFGAVLDFFHSGASDFIFCVMTVLCVSGCAIASLGRFAYIWFFLTLHFGARHVSLYNLVSKSVLYVGILVRFCIVHSCASDLMFFCCDNDVCFGLCNVVSKPGY